MTTGPAFLTLADGETRAFPVLASLLEAGTLTVDGSEYVGRAADGVEVAVGAVGQEPSAERYLKHHPTPDLW